MDANKILLTVLDTLKVDRYSFLERSQKENGRTESQFLESLHDAAKNFNGYQSFEIHEALTEFSKNKGFFEYASFTELYSALLHYKIIPVPMSILERALNESLYLYNYQIFLKNRYVVNAGDEKKYLTINHYKEYLENKKFVEQKEQKEQERIEHDLKPMDKTETPITTINQVKLIKDEANEVVLLSYENNLKGLIEDWNKQEQTELCAAYCLYLIDKKIFRVNKRKTAITFAKQRYNIDITSSFDKLKKATNKALLEEKTETIERKITGKHYGKI